MYTTKLKLVALLFSAVALTTSCDKEEDAPLSANETKQAMAAIDTELTNELADLSESEGFLAMQSLSALSGAGDPFPLGRTSAEAKRNPNHHVRKAVLSLKQMINGPTQSARTQGDVAFDYDENKGIYKWNAADSTFIKTGTSTIIQIEFPAEGSTTNNAIFRLTDYAEVATPDGDEAYSPTTIEATLDVDNVKQASLSVSVQYKGDGTDDPKFADISYFVNPYTIDVDLDDRAASTSSFSQYLSKGNDVLIGWGLTATYNGLKIEENISKLVGTFQLSSAIFTIEINAPSDPNQPVTDYNDIIKISLTIDGKSAGNIVWVTEAGATEPSPYVQFSDGSKERLDVIFESLGATLGELDIIG